VNGTCNPLSEDLIVSLNNGQVNSACKILRDDVWPPSPTRTWIVPVISTGSCPAKFNKDGVIVSFAYIEITSVDCPGSIWAKVRCGLDAPPNSDPGGMYNPSVNPLPPVLVGPRISAE
jgi:hypothetical protein